MLVGPPISNKISTFKKTQIILSHNTLLQNNLFQFYESAHSFRKYLLITYCVFSTVLGTKNRAMNKTDKNTYPQGT